MHVRVNAAISADGKLSTRRREQIRISGDEDFARVDRMRAASDAVLVGVGTVHADDPSLLSHDEDHRRRIDKPGRPARAVADSRARTPVGAAVLAGEATTYLLVSDAAPDDRLERLSEAGADIVRAGVDRVDLRSAFASLEGEGIDEVMVEGGGEILYSLFRAGFVDELWTFVGPTIIGGRAAPTLVDGEGFVDEFPQLELRGVEEVDDGILLEWDVLDR